MSNTHILRFASRACLVAGAVMVIVAVAQFSYARQLAQLTQQGAVITSQSIQLDAAHLDGTIKPAPTLHAAAPVGNVSLRMLVGAFLVLLGLGFHALWILRRDSDREVPVRAVRQREKRQPNARVPARPVRGRTYWLYVQLR